MKKIVIAVIIGWVAFVLGYWINDMKRFAEGVAEDAERLHNMRPIVIKAPVTNENFEDFIYKFIADSAFQLERTEFPLKSMQSHLDKVDSMDIDRSDWKINRLFGLEAYRAQIYDNFERKLRDTNERLFCWEGVENGIRVEFKFNRIDGLWYLVEYNDFSD